jgi:ATP-dependent DNA helicase RecQ
MEAQGLAMRSRRRWRLTRDDLDASAVDLAGEERLEAYARSRVEMMRGYAETDACRRRYLLNYFGEELEAERCGRCDNDLGPAAGSTLDDTAERAGLSVGDRVAHEEFGAGVVQRLAEGRVTVAFDDEGYRELDAELVAERGLLSG